MQVDLFREILVPVIGGLGIFMLGLEFMSDGIHNLAANRMRSLLAKIAGTPSKGLFAGTLITGVLQSSTAMTVMIVGLVNAGVVGLRPAISVIMGANIGTTLGNGLIALPLGPLGLITGGICALIYVFARNDKTRNIALACMGFSLIFYGLNLMTGGLKPLRNMPEIMAMISTLNANSFGGLLMCVFTAAGITAMIHSSSATIGIVMGLGAAGILDWQTAVAFSLGGDLGTTVTSWMASLNLTKNAKRAAYAHIAFNFIGVAVMLPLFFPAMELLKWVMGFFGGDPGAPVMVAGKETYPLVPVAVGIYSIGFNIFNTVLLFPFIGVFERVLSRIGASSDKDEEDYAITRYLDPKLAASLLTGVPAVQSEMKRYVEGATLLLGNAREGDKAKLDAHDHFKALDSLSRDIRRYTASMLPASGQSPAQADLLASLIEEEDFSGALGESLYQVTRRIERQPFEATGQALLGEVLTLIEQAVGQLTHGGAPLSAVRERQLKALRDRVLAAPGQISWEERGALLAILGTAERIFFLVDRIALERQSVSRDLARFGEQGSKQPALGLGSAVPA